MIEDMIVSLGFQDNWDAFDDEQKELYLDQISSVAGDDYNKILWCLSFLFFAGEIPSMNPATLV